MGIMTIGAEAFPDRGVSNGTDIDLLMALNTKRPHIFNGLEGMIPFLYVAEGAVSDRCRPMNEFTLAHVVMALTRSAGVSECLASGEKKQTEKKAQRDCKSEWGHDRSSCRIKWKK